VPADILDRGPDNRQATGLGREHINLIGTLPHIAEQALNGIGSTARDVPGALRSSHQPLQQNPRQVSLNRA
jgi:hypothetical protein